MQFGGGILVGLCSCKGRKRVEEKVHREECVMGSLLTITINDHDACIVLVYNQILLYYYISLLMPVQSQNGRGKVCFINVLVHSSSILLHSNCAYDQYTHYIQCKLHIILYYPYLCTVYKLLMYLPSEFSASCYIIHIYRWLRTCKYHWVFWVRTEFQTEQDASKQQWIYFPGSLQGQ